MAGAAAPALTFERASWADARPALAAALRGADSSVGEEVASGHAEAWRIDHGDGGAASYMVTRLEGSELVIVAYQGRRVVEVMREVISKARAKGLESLRFHAATPALARLVREFAPVPVEYVSRVVL